ncbi:hypothetical protein PSTT_10127 [Puccinia striiformis]|uniref:Uncharacterized protein n=1 Tax=Puccinia striiformis TaxID=27350 RepID=A0A2S4V5P8_9BASI|nr:hypothetical protein PSTT_10127 [Puccinia striiformis]
MSSPKLRTSQTGWKSATQFGQIPTTCSFHLTSLSLARQTNRKCNRPKPPTHPSVPSFKLSLNEPSHLSSARRQSIRIKSQKNLDEFAWKHDSCKNVLRRRDSVTGKFIHAKKDWMADPKRNFLKIKWEDRLIRLDKDYVDERKRDFHEQQQAEEEEDGGEKLSRPPKQMWKLPRQEFNRGAPTQILKNMLGLASSSNGKRLQSSSTSTSDLPFFTSTSPLEIDFCTIQPQNRFSNHHRSSLISISNSLNQFIKSDWRNSIGRIILKPTYRKNITNFVFFSAFISACICVGAQSVFPNAGFHSNYHHYLKLNHLKNSSMSSKHQEEDEEKPRTTQSLFCPGTHS